MPSGVTRAAATAPLALDPNDTIAAIASPPGPAARGIVPPFGAERSCDCARWF